MSKKTDKLIKVKCIKDLGADKKGDVRDMYESTYNSLKEFFTKVKAEYKESEKSTENKSEKPKK